eukprot:TRINITY_DN31658_c0_g1_i1.p1 TRINITY_DN31658_c0_g1~~TRINITY_DN31658_c0_g1_i1.p1  ORF type:complete len:133 (-),score=5.30 TRINITY_DN31658_c0_g1_i1:87-485(-)
MMNMRQVSGMDYFKTLWCRARPSTRRAVFRSVMAASDRLPSYHSSLLTLAGTLLSLLVHALGIYYDVNPECVMIIHQEGMMSYLFAQSMDMIHVIEGSGLPVPSKDEISAIVHFHDIDLSKAYAALQQPPLC